MIKTVNATAPTNRQTKLNNTTNTKNAKQTKTKPIPRESIGRRKIPRTQYRTTTGNHSMEERNTIEFHEFVELKR